MAATALGQACALIRYVVLARLLGPEQLGLVATIMLVSQFFESVADTGSDRFMVQDRDGDEPEMQRLIQLVILGRGLLVAFGLAVVAAPIASFLYTPLLGISLAVLALVPLLDGLQHLDMQRSQRRQDFRTVAFATMVAEGLGLFATVMAAFVLRDFTAILYGLIARSAVMTIASHLHSERRYGLGYSKVYGRRILLFAAPLLANGLLMFLASQSDRVIVGNQLGLAELGHYSAVLLLVLYPTVMLQRSISAIYLPQIAAGRDDVAQRDAVADRLGAIALFLAVGMSLGFVLVAPLAVKLLYGETFVQPVLVIAIIGILQTARFLRLAPTTTALAMGRSSVLLISNVTRMVGIPLAITGLHLVGGIVGIVAGFALGELVALITASCLVNLYGGRSIVSSLGRIPIFIASALAILLGAVSYDEGSWVRALVALVAGAILAIWYARSEMRFLKELYALGQSLLSQHGGRIRLPKP